MALDLSTFGIRISAFVVAKRAQLTRKSHEIQRQHPRYKYRCLFVRGAQTCPPRATFAGSLISLIPPDPTADPNKQCKGEEKIAIHRRDRV